MDRYNFQISVKQTDPRSEEVVSLIDELSSHLQSITGRDGRDSFSHTDMETPRSVFLAAYLDGKILGCGALRPFDEKTCELKRMYAKEKGVGVGKVILNALERYALDLAYRSIILETGVQNKKAIDFYLRNGYQMTENFGRYINRSECICFKKMIKS